jgi:hypothetical protein
MGWFAHPSPSCLSSPYGLLVSTTLLVRLLPLFGPTLCGPWYLEEKGIWHRSPSIVWHLCCYQFIHKAHRENHREIQMDQVVVARPFVPIACPISKRWKDHVKVMYRTYRYKLKGKDLLMWPLNYTINAKTPNPIVQHTQCISVLFQSTPLQ